MNIQFKLRFLFILLALSSITKIQSNEDYSLGKTLLISIGTFGIYPIYKAFFYKNDFELLDQAIKDYDRVKIIYSTPLAILDDSFKVTSLEETQKNKENVLVLETTLFKLKSSVSREKSTFFYLSNLRHNIGVIKGHNEALKNRIKKLNRKWKDEKKEVINDMVITATLIEQLIPKLEFLHELVTSHKSYFDLNKFMLNLSLYYKPELSALNIEADDYARKIDRLKRSARSKHHDTLYPLIRYVDLMNFDLCEVDKKTRHLEFSYKNLVSDAKQFQAKLSAIKNYIVGDSEYFTELRELELEKMRKMAFDLTERVVETLEQDVQNRKLELESAA